MNKKKFFICWGLVGLFFPVIITGIYYIDKTWEIMGCPWKAVFSEGSLFFWPSRIQLMALMSIKGIAGTIFVYSFSIGFNILYYLILGGIMWLGRTYSRLLYIFPPLITYLIWYEFLFDGIWC